MGTFTLGLDVSPERNLSRYLNEIRKFPMLAAEEELALARSWRDRQDIEASHKLVTSHLRLVVKIATGYKGYGLPLGELIAEGNIGIMHSVKRFDPELGFRFSTYAMWWVRAAVQEYILRSWSLVKIGTTAAQKKLFFNLRKMKTRIGAMDEGDMSPAQVASIAERLKVSAQEVINMNRRLSAPDSSLNAPLRDEEDGEWQDRLVDDKSNQEETLAGAQEFAVRHELLAAAMGELSQRESFIFTERRMKEDPSTLENLSRQFNISRERVRQIEVMAFNKVRKSVKNAAAGRRLSC
ncbi:MAG: RNA polymerase factor sigma-32 [Rhodospirillales bacterium RIFCSPLOWO2_12_FULL_58_28]|nr:MAG: RNA polymerase factor sigma-32 [Rhodospirillales bacterium RIFCSPLOWO2_02_FULL_58_16]OHC77084.1 MAG: RNA polymerase factor sigma-32 [Rhodospirillales bacterium RIFCSPLOWO2_12_FULL_58_28]